MKVIDPHVHLFDLALGNYDWLEPHNPPDWPDKAIIQRNFSCDDLTLAPPLSLSGFVHIEAGFDNAHPWKETQWLERTINQPFRSVSGVNLLQAPKHFNPLLTKLSEFQSVVGVRHILDEEAESVLTTGTAKINLELVADYGWTFEAQLCADDLAGMSALNSVLDAIPDLPVIINHAGFPPLETKRRFLWQQMLEKIAENPGVAIKASGWEMVDRHYPAVSINNVIGTLVSIFDDDRVMLASNFPLCLFNQSYKQLWQHYLTLQLPDGLRQKLMHDNAKAWYRL